jgi:hypothetical protein
MSRWYNLVLIFQVLIASYCLLPENQIFAQKDDKGVEAEPSGYADRAHSLVLLIKKPVQDELKLDRDIRVKLDEMFGSQQRNPDPKERWKKNIELGKAAEKLLTPSQLKRFREISLQSHGISAMTDSIVTEELSLTKEQQMQVRSIQSKFARQLKELPPGELEKQFLKLQDERMDEIIGLLSPEQRRKFDKMKGEPFDVKSLLPK